MLLSVSGSACAIKWHINIIKIVLSAGNNTYHNIFVLPAIPYSWVVSQSWLLTTAVQNEWDLYTNGLWTYIFLPEQIDFGK